MSNNEVKKMIVCDNVVKIYKTDEIEVVALQGLDLEVESGEIMAIIGNSGSGKSTLLNMLGGLDMPSAGTVMVNGIDLLRLNDKQLELYKRDTVGFVWQNTAQNLIPYLTALENVELPMILNGKRKRWMAIEILEMVGLGPRKNNKLKELSGGEQQRVAIAIAVANSPKLVLADEPTGSVDTATTDHIMEVFNELNRATGITMVIVTHDQQISRKVDRVVAIRDGKTSSEFIRKKSYVKELDEIKNGTIHDPLEEAEESSHEELAVLDKAGRVQIPKEYLESMGIKGNKIRIERDQGKLILVPPEEK